MSEPNSCTSLNPNAKGVRVCVCVCVCVCVVLVSTCVWVHMCVLSVSACTFWVCYQTPTIELKVPVKQPVVYQFVTTATGMCDSNLNNYGNTHELISSELVTCCSSASRESSDYPPTCRRSPACRFLSAEVRHVV